MVEGREDAGGRFRAKDRPISAQRPWSMDRVIVRARTSLSAYAVIEVLDPRLSSRGKAVTPTGTDR
jgi:hypothetical protein